MNKKILYILLLIIVIETICYFILRDSAVTQINYYESLASSTPALVKENKEYARLNQEYIDQNKKIREDNERILQVNKNLAETLKRYCPECVIKEAQVFK